MTGLAVIGLDLSLTSSGVACIPLDWDGDMRRVSVGTVRHRHVPQDDTARAERISTVAQRCLCLGRELAAGHGIAMWGIESLPTARAYAQVPLGELHGVVRYLLHQGGAQVVTVPQASARKLLMGSLPRKDAKRIVNETVTSIDGAAAWGGDECDAFVAGQWVVSELGGYCLATTEGSR